MMEQLTEGLDKLAKEAQKAFDQGKVKVEQLQVERHMDGAARKLGYLEFDRYRERVVDEAARESLLQQMAAYEDQIVAAQAATAATDQATQAAAQGQPPAGTPPAYAPGEPPPAWETPNPAVSESAAAAVPEGDPPAAADSPEATA